MNTTELFQPEYGRLAVPASTILVHVNGVLCAPLEPVEIVRGAWPEFGWARLVYNASALQQAVAVSPEHIEDLLAMGQRISLHQLFNRAAPDVAVADLPLFVGQIEGIETTIRSGEERIEVVAKDFSATLQRITVYGQRILRHDGSTALLPGLSTVFNPLGQANATAEPVVIDGRTRTVFSAEEGQGRMWTCAEAIYYLLNEYIPGGTLHWAGFEQLLALTQARSLQDLDVTGLTLLEALHRCGDAAGIHFQFVPRMVETAPSQTIVFYRVSRERTVELNCQPAGESLSLSRTSIGAMNSNRACYPVTRRHIGQGDFKVYEATFELVKAWDPSLQGINHSVFCASGNPEFYKVKDVYRKWCLNEAGDYSDPPYDQGEPYDFSRLFEQATYARRRRRFWPALTTDAQGRSLGYFLQVSFDGGQHWWLYQHAFSNLLDECGIWLSSDQLDIDTWIAALKGVLRFRITASVVSDERLTCTVCDGPVGSTIPVVDHLLTLPRRFAYRKVSTQSIYAQTPTAGLGPPNEADDSAALHQFVRQQAALSPAIIERTEVQTPTLHLHLRPGDRVTSSPESRDLLNCRRDNRSTTWIERVHMDFRNQCTNLHLVRQRRYEE